jgi:hypothetical protein
MMDRRENLLAILAHKPHDPVGDYSADMFGTGHAAETFENGPGGWGLTVLALNGRPRKPAWERERHK